MPPGTSRWHRGQKQPGTRKVRRVLILCEDTKSSRFYLGQFPFDPGQVQIECVGTGMNTDSLMEEAIARKAKAEAGKAPYEQIWVVFDKDDFPLQNFNRAFDLAQAHPTIRACWSNECFEIWYLLHFCYRDTGVGRSEIWKLISGYLGKSYDKASDEIFAQLSPKIRDALRNAARLAYENRIMGQARRNPSTFAHELIKVLRDHDPAKQKT
ncbi:MAG TPA: RloB family protein [Dongiaceae bacterium]|nr:RloB family protein [Dongiaceae bacterium]